MIFLACSSDRGMEDASPSGMDLIGDWRACSIFTSVILLNVALPERRLHFQLAEMSVSVSCISFGDHCTAALCSVCALVLPLACILENRYPKRCFSESRCDYHK